MQGPGAELHEIAATLRRSAVEVAAIGSRLQHRAAVVVWHASAAEAFRGRMSARRTQADAVARGLEHAAVLIEAHAAAAARADWLRRAMRRLPWP